MADRELPPNPPGLVIRQERARGSYGAVYSGELDGKPVVVKRIHLALLQAPHNDKLMGDFYSECRILSTVRHANVVRFIAAYWDQEAKEPLLVMEEAKENLKEYLERNKGHLGVEKQLAICSSMTEGLSFLHTRAEPIIHRDLKPQNVLVWEDGAVKIADFGQSKLLDHPQDYMKTTQPGTVAYMPPEALKKNPRYSSKVDVFSLGVVMLEVGTQSPPSVWLEGIGAVPEVERHKDDLALLQDTHPLKPLIIWCLQDNHESRPDVKSTQDQVILLSGGVKEPEYQQRIHQLEGELRESREREADLRGRLEEAALELRRAKAQVANLERLVEKGQRDLKQSRMRYEEVEKHLTSTIRTTNEELEAVRRELRIVTRDLSDTKKDKKSLEAELTHLRQTLDAWTATVERRDEECLSKVKELEALLSSRKCSVTMQSAGEHTSKSPTSLIPPNPFVSPTTDPSQIGGGVPICLEEEAVVVDMRERSTSSHKAGEKNWYQVKENVEMGVEKKSTSSRSGAHTGIAKKSGKVVKKLSASPISLTAPKSPTKRAPVNNLAQPQKAKRLLRATFDYYAINEDELTLKAGDIVEFLADEEEGWCKGLLRGKIGLLPSNFVEEVPT